MKQLNVWRESPIWFIFATMAVLVALLLFANEGAVTSLWTPELRSYTPSISLHLTSPAWGTRSGVLPLTFLGFVRPLLCLLLGLICLLFGITRSINKLSGKASYLLAFFLILFSLSTTEVLGIVSEIFERAPLFIIHRIVFFSYPIPLFIFFYDILRPSLHKWVWPLVFLPAAYSVSIWIIFLITGYTLPLSASIYSEFSAILFAIFLTVCIFGTLQKTHRRFMRIVAAYWGLWMILNTVLSIIGFRQFYRHNQFLTGVLISSIIIIWYLLFTGTKELFTYKSEAEFMDIRNRLIVENYQNLEIYMNQIARVKHDMRGHISAMKILLDDGEHDRLAAYLRDIQDSYLEMNELIACGNRLIQSILGHSAGQAQQLDFKISFDISPLPSLTISDVDTVSLLTNLLNNALDSCKKEPLPEKRWIAVTIKCIESHLYISVKNALSDKVKHVGDRYISTKKSALFHGHGISIIRDIAEKYDGYAQFDYNDDSFIAEVALCVVAAEGETMA